MNPLRQDAEGFRWRTRAQIDERRSWLWEEGKILFKAEASAWTPAAIQIQQVWVDPEARNRKNAQRGMRDLVRLLLERVPGLLFVQSGERPRDSRVRGDRDGPDEYVPLAAVLGGRSANRPSSENEVSPRAGAEIDAWPMRLMNEPSTRLMAMRPSLVLTPADPGPKNPASPKKSHGPVPVRTSPVAEILPGPEMFNAIVLSSRGSSPRPSASR